MKKIIVVLIVFLGFSMAMADTKATGASKAKDTKLPKTQKTQKNAQKPDTQVQKAAQKADAQAQQPKATGALDKPKAAKAQGQEQEQVSPQKPKPAEKPTASAQGAKATGASKKKSTDKPTDSAKKSEKAPVVVVNVGEKKEEKKPDSGWHGSFGMNLLYAWNMGDIKEGGLTQIDFVGDNNEKILNGLGSEIYLTFEHPIPFLPNFKFQYTGLRTSKGAKSSVFDSMKGDAAAVLYADNNGTMNTKGFIDYSHIDTTLYYRLVPADIAFQFDLGLTARYYIYPLNRLIPATPSTAITSATADGTENRTYQIMPMIYVDMTGIVPDTGLSFTIAGNFMVLNKDNYMNDWKASIKYAMEFVPYVHPGIELGSRYLATHSTAKIKATGKTFTTDLHNVIIYAGVFLSF